MLNLFRKKAEMVDSASALPGRAAPIPTAQTHFVNGRPLKAPYPGDCETVILGMGCFWGAERKFWQAGEGVYVTAAGYAGGFTPNPTYEETCSGRTGHTEAVLVVFRPRVLPFEDVLRLFWEGHDPTQGMRQGNDVGTQYRSALFTATPDQYKTARASAEIYGRELKAAGHGPITTEIAQAGPFYFAEAYHQQYLAKNPGGYCGIGGTGVSCPAGLRGA